MSRAPPLAAAPARTALSSYPRRCSRAARPATACARGTRRRAGSQYYLSADPASLDPAVSSDVQSGEVVALLFDNLVQFDADARLQPGLATRWESDASGHGSTPFTSGPAPTFHDGRPIGAADVRASIVRALEPGSRAAPAVAAVSDPGRPRRTPPARRRASRGIARAGRHDHRLHADRAAQHLSQVPRDAGGGRRADADAAGLRPGAGRQRALAVRLVVARRRHRAWRGTRRTGPGRPRRTPSRCASSPRR